MRRFVVFVALLAVAVAGLVLYWRQQEGSPIIRLKATATVLVDGVERSGTAVQEFQLQWIYEPQIGRTGAWRVAARGEAITVEVPGAEPVYVLMSTSSGGDYGFMVEAQCTIRNMGPEEQKRSFMDIQRCVFEHYPMAIRFDGSGDFDTAIPVFAAGEGRNGYQFLRMVLERTDAPISWGTIPSEIWDGERKVIYAPFETYKAVAGEYSFKAEEFQ